MTDEELDEIESLWKPTAFCSTDASDALTLVAEVRRLKGIIKRVEWTQDTGNPPDSVCAFCGAMQHYQTLGIQAGQHRPDCEAFNPDGSVK